MSYNVLRQGILLISCALTSSRLDDSPPGGGGGGSWAFLGEASCNKGNRILFLLPRTEETKWTFTLNGQDGVCLRKVLVSTENAE